jgi:hypothetical protein
VPLARQVRRVLLVLRVTLAWLVRLARRVLPVRLVRRVQPGLLVLLVPTL